MFKMCSKNIDQIFNTTPKTKECIRKMYNEIANKVGN